MPFDPRCPYDLSLDQFADVPVEERPVFTFRRLNGAEYIQLESVFELAGKKASECSDDLYRILAVGLIDWKRQFDPATGKEIAFEPSRLNEIVDHVDAFELVNKRLSRARVNGAELKNSESPVS